MYRYVRGTPFQFAGQVQDDGVPMDLTGATITANMYDQTGTILIASLVVTILEATEGMLSVTFPTSTITWPLGKAQMFFLMNIPNNNGPIVSDPAYLRIEQNPMIG
jgi:hypothetical protein